MTKETNEQFIEIETRLAFQEDLLEGLNSMVIEQQKQLEQLWAANKLLKQQMEKMHFDIGGGEEEAPPPHY